MALYSSQFTLKGGEIAKSLKLLQSDQIQTIVVGQAYFDLATKAGVILESPDVFFKKYQSVTALENLARQSGIDVTEMNNLATSFDRGAWPEHAPKFMDIGDYTGFLPKAASNSLLGAQGGARTAETLSAIEQGVPSKVSLAETLNLANKQNKIFVGKDEPPYVEAAQSIEHMSRVMQAAVSENKELASNKHFKRAVTAMELLAAQSFKESAKDAKKHGLSDAYDQMQNARESLKEDTKYRAALSSTSTLISQVERGMKEVAKASPQHAGAVDALLNERKPRMQKLNVVGSLIMPSFMFSRDNDLPFADRIRQEGRGGGGRGV